MSRVPSCPIRRRDGEPLPLRLPIIAFGHQSRVGKDTAARAVERAVTGAERVAFADGLKAFAHQLFQPYGLQPRDHYDRNPQDRTKPLKALRHGYWPVRGDEDPAAPTAVDVWVEFGRACRRIAPDVWVDRVLRRTRLDPVKLIVISDLRFPNEFRRVREAGGWCVRIDRPDERLPVHGSDRELDAGWPWDAVITNTGSVEDLERAAVDVADRYLNGNDAERIERLAAMRADAERDA